MKALRCLLFLAPVIAVFLVPTPARADVYVLNVDHCTGGCGTAPFGTITTTNIVGGVHVVISLAGGAKFVQGGQPGSTVGFNLIGNPNISLANETLAGWTLDSSTAGSLHFDGFGNFEYSLNCCFSQTGGSNAQAGPIEFDILGAVTTASFNELSTGGDPNTTWAVDILSTNGNTGPVGVPEPASLLTLGLAVVGLGLASRKLKLRN